ncbi:hypothetical protein PybrP1_006672 [[Pythium] brassicae (nom. inval.)]|nr:hypothetical protein PybrP1_006672 [[Pythium] brassicae (nom. inval.)]
MFAMLLPGNKTCATSRQTTAITASTKQLRRLTPLLGRRCPSGRSLVEEHVDVRRRLLDHGRSGHADSVTRTALHRCCQLNARKKAQGVRARLARDR